MQKWYRANKKRCFRSISTDKDSPRCEIPLKDLKDYFTVTPPIPPTTPPPDGFPNTDGSSEPDELSYDVTPEEVKSQLRCLPAQSSPGPNGAPYYLRHLLYESEDARKLENKHHHPHPQKGRHWKPQQLAAYLLAANCLQDLCSHPREKASHMGHYEQKDLLSPERIPPVRRMPRTLLYGREHHGGQQEEKQRCQNGMARPKKCMWIDSTSHDVVNDGCAASSLRIDGHLQGDI